MAKKNAYTIGLEGRLQKTIGDYREADDERIALKEKLQAMTGLMLRYRRAYDIAMRSLDYVIGTLPAPSKRGGHEILDLADGDFVKGELIVSREEK